MSSGRNNRDGSKRKGNPCISDFFVCVTKRKTSDGAGDGQGGGGGSNSSCVAGGAQARETSADHLVEVKGVQDCAGPSFSPNAPGTSSACAAETRREECSSSAAPAGALTSSSHQQCGSSENRLEYDVGEYAGSSKLPPDHVVAALLEKHWSPPQGYDFPYSVHKKSGSEERRFVRREHLQNFTWLALSPKQRGLFCKCCALFAVGQTAGRHGTTPLKGLVTEPLQKFAKLLGKTGVLEMHAETDYHRTAMQKAETFLYNYYHPPNVIANRLDSDRTRRVQENKDRILTALQNVIFLGRQNIAFRGHRDSGRINLERTDCTNQGNFKELLYFRVQCGDDKVEKQVRTAGVRNQFTSKTTQNELIECCGEEILSVILERVQQSDFYSIGFDETTDISHQSQMSVFVRYLYNDTIREDFLGFVNPRAKPGKRAGETEDESGNEETGSEGEDQETGEKKVTVSEEELKLTGERIGEVVLETTSGMNLDVTTWVGIATDGCSVMTSEVKGAVAVIQKVAVNAERTPCFSHALNLSISKSSTVQPIRNAVGIIKEVVSFFRASPKRNSVLSTFLGKQLPQLCETRFIERHDGVVNFVADIEKVADALESVSDKWNGGTDASSAAKAKSLLSAISHGEFLIATICLGDVLGITRSLSIYLQSEDIDLQSASENFQTTVDVLEKKREKAEEEFAVLFRKAEEIAHSLGTEVKLPRLTGRQTHRANVGVPATGEITAETYFRVNLFIPLLESIVEDLKSRIPSEVLNVFRLNTFLPHRCVRQDGKETAENLQVLSEKYARALRLEADVQHTRLKSEYTLWIAKWTRAESSSIPLPKTAVESRAACPENFVPHVRKMLSILAVLPVSICTSERSFSTLKNVKTYLRQKRLNGLALLFIHRDIPLDREKVIERYIGKGGKNRRGYF